MGLNYTRPAPRSWLERVKPIFDDHDASRPQAWPHIFAAFDPSVRAKKGAKKHAIDTTDRVIDHLEKRRGHHSEALRDSGLRYLQNCGWTLRELVVVAANTRSPRSELRDWLAPCVDVYRRDPAGLGKALERLRSNMIRARSRYPFPTEYVFGE